MKSLGSIRLDPKIALLPTFREQSRSAERLPSCDTTYSRRNGATTLETHVPLNSRMQSVLYAAIRAIASGAATASAACDDPKAMHLWRALRPSDLLAEAEAGLTTTSMRSLVRAAGFPHPGEPAQKSVWDALSCLATARVVRWTAGLPVSSQLLVVTRDEAGVHLALEPQLTQIARGVRGKNGKPLQFIPICLDERYRLSTPCARLLHTWFSAWVWNIHTTPRVITLERLEWRVWRDEPHRTTASRRRRALLEALLELANLGRWHVEIDGTRCRIRQRASPHEATTAE